MDTTQKILDALKRSSKPMSAGELAITTGVDRKEIDKAMKKLKEDGKISSPQRCFWTLAK